MRFRVLIVSLVGLLLISAGAGSAQTSPLQFEGNTRACAGAIDDDLHQLRLTVRGFGSSEAVKWQFEGVTQHDEQGNELLPPRLWDGTQWSTTLTTRSNAHGVVLLRILSGQTAEKPRLVARVGETVRGEITLDLAAPEMRRRFPEPFIDNDYEWRLPDSDYGYLFDYGLALTGKREHGKVYLKFRLDPARGDVDGNWRVVNGHRLKISVSKITFNENIFRSDGAKVTALTTEQDTAPYLRVHNPQDATATSHIVTTTGDGSASFTLVTGPKYNLRDDNYPQHYVEAQDITVYKPPAKKPVYQVPPVAAQGPAVEWAAAASRLRGDLLLGASERKPQKEHWKIVTLEGNVRREQPFSTGTWIQNGFSVGNPFWSSDGSRFGLTAFGTGNDHMMTIGLYRTKTQVIEAAIEPPYTSWKAFSPDARRFAFVRGSTNVVGSSRVGDDFSLHVWDGKFETKLPVNHTFLATDYAEAMACWRGADELLVTQEASGKSGGPKPNLSIVAVAADGKSRAEPIVRNGWKPVASPDGRLIAFFGPESPRQKPTKYYVSAPLDQALCIARHDGQPMRSGDIGYADRLPLDRFVDSYPALFWPPDSTALYAASVVGDDEEPFIEVWRFDAATGKRKRVAAWDYQVPRRAVSNHFRSHQWSFSGVSADGQTLFATFTQKESDPKDIFMLQTHQWFAVNLTTGAVEKLATIRGTDFAWHSR